MKRLIAFVLCSVLLLGVGCGKKSAVLIEQPENLYVADQADVLSEQTEAYVVSRVRALREACGGEIAVVTVDYLDGLTAEEYAYTVLNQWGIGDKQKNNGMVVLLTIGDNKCWLTPGYGIEDDFPSTQCTDYLTRYLWQFQNAGDCDTGVQRLVDALIDWYGDYYGVSVFSSGSGMISADTAQGGESAGGLFSGSGILTLLAVGFVIFLLIQKAERKSGYRRKRSYFIPLMLFNNLRGSGSYHGSSGSSHVGHSGGGGTHGGGGGAG